MSLDKYSYIPLRAPAEMLERANSLIKPLAELHPDSKVTRADVLRLALERGLDALERQLAPEGAKASRKR